MYITRGHGHFSTPQVARQPRAERCEAIHAGHDVLACLHVYEKPEIALSGTNPALLLMYNLVCADKDRSIATDVPKDFSSIKTINIGSHELVQGGKDVPGSLESSADARVARRGEPERAR